MIDSLNLNLQSEERSTSNSSHHLTDSFQAVQEIPDRVALQNIELYTIENKASTIYYCRPIPVEQQVKPLPWEELSWKDISVEQKVIYEL